MPTRVEEQKSAIVGGNLARGYAPELQLAMLRGEPAAGPGLRLYAELAAPEEALTGFALRQS